VQILDFAEFARRRSVPAKPPAEQSAYVAVNTDRWAALHMPAAEPALLAVRQPDQPADFWADLQLRMAYPTHHLRHH
jgi:hypothetical protein